MQTAQGIEKGDVLQRLAGASFIVGALMLIVLGILHPQADDRSDLAGVIEKIAETNGGLWQVEHQLLAVGFWALMIGAVGVYRSISTGGTAAVFARLGFYGVIVGTALLTVLWAFDGVGLAVVADLWEDAAAADKGTMLLVATAMDGFLNGIRSLAFTAFWLALVFLGIGIAMGAVHPRWLGWVIIVLGAVGAVFSFAFGLITELSDALVLVFVVVSMLTYLWALAMGVWISRKAW